MLDIKLRASFDFFLIQEGELCVDRSNILFQPCFVRKTPFLFRLQVVKRVCKLRVPLCQMVEL